VLVIIASNQSSGVEWLESLSGDGENFCATSTNKAVGAPMTPSSFGVEKSILLHYWK